MSPPNVLLVVLDTARRDAVEPFGAPPGSTPAIADLGRRGAALEHAYATTSWTMPSHASMFSGLLPRRLGLAQAPNGMASVRQVMESLRPRLLPAVLSKRGYATQAWVTNHWVSRYTGFDVGFDEFVLVDSERTQRMEALLSQGRRAQLAWAREGLAARSDDGAAEVRRQLTRAIERWDGRPTFWFVNLTECHSPYLPPRPWNDLPAWDRVRAALEVRAHLNFLAICLFVAGAREVSREAFDLMHHLYRRSISYMDHWIADILAALDARHILDDTLVIITSDHGENFGEQGLIAHGFSLDQRLINVPLVIAGPGTPDTNRVISLAEMPRLIASAAGLLDVPWQKDELPPGVAASQYDPMGTAEHPAVQQFARDHQLTAAALEPICARYTAVTNGDLKLVVRNDQETLYDLRIDPGERHGLPLPDHSADLEILRSALDHPALDGPDESLEPVGGPPPPPSAEELEAIERQMKLLGYL